MLVFTPLIYSPKSVSMAPVPSRIASAVCVLCIVKGVSSRGIGGYGHGHNSLPQLAGGSASSQQIDFHHPRFRFLMAPWAPRAPSVWRSTCGDLKPKPHCPSAFAPH